MRSYSGAWIFRLAAVVARSGDTVQASVERAEPRCQGVWRRGRMAHLGYAGSPHTGFTASKPCPESMMHDGSPGKVRTWGAYAPTARPIACSSFRVSARAGVRLEL